MLVELYNCAIKTRINFENKYSLVWILIRSGRTTLARPPDLLNFDDKIKKIKTKWKYFSPYFNYFFSFLQKLLGFGIYFYQKL